VHTNRIATEDIDFDSRILSFGNQNEHIDLLAVERDAIMNKIAPKSVKPRKTRKEKKAVQPEREIVSSVAEHLDTLPAAAAEPHAFENHNLSEASFESQTQWGTTIEEGRPTPTQKTKIKTRYNKTAMEGGLQDLNLENEPELLVAWVKKDAFEVFHAMFSSGTAQKPHTKWEVFVKAFCQVGFSVRHSGGSAVAFEPEESSKWFGWEKIVIHRPHPDSDVDPVMLQSIGKRMTRRFCWTASSFQLE
jgi:hypothetical protein